ncbi:heme-binding protein [Actinoallomurus spadix]|uniref:Heme-binding protein n=1 Tax=Actinoallomurus spadix TaxID=79912 RepID=A0ABP3H2V4_9ACTN|nr:heme-binding protein [Actinoallomurus spadix]MCO5987894.1 heme-binding protein [Actinoallomurus spadix]
MTTGTSAVNFVIMSGTPRLPGLTLADADRLVQAALEVGAERGFPPLAVAVVDVTGAPIVLRRGDGGMPMTSRIAVAKARTALLALKPSGQIDLPGGIVDSIQHLYGGDFVPWAGGVLITDGEVILGAVGASGAHAREDEEAVQTAVQRWRENRSAADQT